MKRVPILACLSIFSVVCLVSLFTFTMQAQSPRASDPAAKFKAIWEPVNVKQDLELYAVHFVSPDEGWVAGGTNRVTGGVVLHTNDGGATWETQLGDPQSSDRPYHQLLFVSPALGFATQATGSGDHNLLRTNDGKTWAPAGTVAQHRSDYRFLSADVGFVTAGNTILRTQDGGRRWEPAYQCAVKVEVQGLTRDLPCQFDQIDFATPTIGYAISREVATGAGVVLAKTTDGGASWSTRIILPGEDAKEGALRFTDAMNGALRTINGKLFHTADGGATWSGATGSAGGKPAMQFADKTVGWMMAFNTMTYTTNGGRSWVSRQIAFPSIVNAFSLVQRDRGYAVGNHGMVYRYRVVPIEYVAKGMLAAPSM